MARMTYSTNQVAEVAGATLRQLQWWEERRLFRSSSITHHRRRAWSERDLFKVLLVARMRLKGLSLQRIRKILGNVNIGELQAAPSTTLVITERVARHIYDDPEVIEYCIKFSGPVWIICIPSVPQVGP